MELAEVEFEFNVQTLLYAHFHLDRSIGIRLCANVCYDELLLLRYSIVIPVDDHVDVIAESNDNPVIALKLFLNSVELEIVLDAI